VATHKTLLIPLVEEILLKEIGEANIPPLKWTKVSSTSKVSPTKYKFLVDIGDFTEMATVEFELLDDDVEKQYYIPPKYHHLKTIYNVGYDISGNQYQFVKSDIKTLLKILSTIVDIIKDFINTNEIDGLFIQGTPKELDSKDISKKSNLYKAFIQKQLNQIPNYGSDTHRDGFILIKTK
jgi:hypothetical protein